ncbi:hypothetical protein U1Q18_018400 [Sarracenia purpurea var. burkii]
MASAIKKVNKIGQIVRLKQLMQRWKHMSLRRHPVLSGSSSDGDGDRDGSGSGGRPQSRRTIPCGSIAIYVGYERRRFVIPTRFLNLPVFVALLNKAEEEFGLQRNGGLVLPCEVEFFKGVLEFLERDEQRYRALGIDEFVRMFSEVGFDSCKDTVNVCSSNGLTPLLQKTRV